MRQREVFSSDEEKNVGNTGCIPEAFCKIWRKKIRFRAIVDFFGGSLSERR
jgi:hypothetical protein